MSRPQKKYIDLKSNGRLFPSWILANFKEYELPDIIKGTGDPCNTKQDTNVTELRKYQKFISQYMDFKSPYRNILIYHGLGSGKGATTINIYNSLYNYTPGWNVFILIKAALKSTWLNELEKFLDENQKKFRMENIYFINYDSPFADRSFLDITKNVDNSKKSIYIIEECHNFIRNVYGNITSNKGKRAQVIYDYIIQDKRDNPDTRVILLSGTPGVNAPFELALMFNLLRPGIFPRSESKFNQIFLDTGTHSGLNKQKKNLFQRRIMGLVTYFHGATPDLFARKVTDYVDVTMSQYQEEIYSYYEDIEMVQSRTNPNNQLYKSYTRQACNYTFPAISQSINGELRPRPGKFRISEREAEKLMEGKVNDEKVKEQKGSDNFMNITAYQLAIDNFINGITKLYDKLNSDDVKKGHTILNDVKTFIEKYDNNYSEFVKNEKTKSTLFNQMYISSAKFLNIIFNVMISPGPVVVFSNYVLMEGLQIFKIFLAYFGFYNFMETKKLDPSRLGYVEYHGNIKERSERDRGMTAFNDPKNVKGNLIRIILISPAGSEGLNLMNVRQLHVVESGWSYVKLTQTIGRAVRQCSHKMLKPEDRVVNIYIYKSVRSDPTKWTTDQYIESISRTKDSIIQSFLDAIKEVAVDCVLYRKQNMISEQYKCFQFEEPSLFDDNIGPAYKNDIIDDMKIDNGSNSMNSVTVKIQVLKIQAVKLLSSPDEPVEYSQVQNYWYYPKSSVVYDYDLHYAIGKIQLDDDGLPVKLDDSTYIIDKVIPIPLIK